MRRATLILAGIAAAGAAAAGVLGWRLAAAERALAARVLAERAVDRRDEALLSFANKVVAGVPPEEALARVASEGNAAPAKDGDRVVYGPLVARLKDGRVEALCFSAPPANHPCADFVEARDVPVSDRKN